jgi:hypothetical protein
MIIGLQADAFAHANIPELETFWTPWHALMYSGIFACFVTIAWVAWPYLQAPDRSVLGWWGTPVPLRFPLAGMALLIASGAIDTLWHNVFGIEEELDIFFSPSHTGLILGMVLVGLGPVFLCWAEEDKGYLGRADVMLVTWSLVMAMMPLHIYSNHASALGFPAIGTGSEPMPIAGQDATWLHGYVLSTVLLLAPIAVWGKRWRLPVGVPSLLVCIPAGLIWLSLGGMAVPLFVLGFGLGAAVSELGCRLAANRMADRYGSETAWMIGGAVAALLMWAVTLAACAIAMPAAIDPSAGADYVNSLDYNADGVVDVVKYGWSVHTTTGILLMTAITGALTVTGARRLIGR